MSKLISIYSQRRRLIVREDIIALALPGLTSTIDPGIGVGLRQGLGERVIGSVRGEGGPMAMDRAR